MERAKVKKKSGQAQGMVDSADDDALASFPSLAAPSRATGNLVGQRLNLEGLGKLLPSHYEHQSRFWKTVRPYIPRALAGQRGA